ncbi:MAG: methyltransferase domain-containing protein [Firmicutes bacterium]|nr:methyltransferase domain-containing protein [Bacillota bacterium]
MPGGVYGSFAQVYDRFMSGTPYKKWFAFIKRLWAENAQSPGLVLDLACGTGTFTKILADEDYDVIGLDASPDMLAAARQKLPGALLTCQDMRRFELYGTVDAAVCLCDSVNYLRGEDELTAMLACVNNYLNPGGLFVFDIKTVFKFESMFGDNTFADAAGDAAYIWSNRYDGAARVNTYKVDFFVRRESGLYERFTEIHRQKAFTVGEVTAAIEKSGLALAGCYDGNGFGAVTEKSKRVFFAAREKTKSEYSRKFPLSF